MRSDRVGYVVGGAVLIAWSLRRPSLARAAVAGLGGWLLYQAYTGSTPVLKPLGIRENLPLAADGEIEITREAAGGELGWRVVCGEKLLRFGSLGAALALVMGRSPQQAVVVLENSVPST